MYRTCIAVVDASRARLFTLERSAAAGGVEEMLVEHRDLVNPARRQRASELFSDSRPGSSRTGNAQFGYDDHRDAHIDRLDAEFSRLVTDQVAGLLRDNPAGRLIVCASPHMLGELREARGTKLGAVEIDEVPRDLVKLSPAQLRDQLVTYGLLPERPRRAGLA